jgi:hypothetical protein
MEWCLTVPPDTPRVFYSTFAWLTTSEQDKVVFHRYFGNLDTNIWYGYDAVLDPHRPSGKITFERPNEHPALPANLAVEMPIFWASGARLVSIQDLPVGGFEAGRNMALTLATLPDSGRKVVDYIRIDSIGVLDTVQAVGSSLIHRHLGSFWPDGSSARDRYSRPLQDH